MIKHFKFCSILFLYLFYSPLNGSVCPLSWQEVSGFDWTVRNAEAYSTGEFQIPKTYKSFDYDPARKEIVFLRDSSIQIYSDQQKSDRRYLENENEIEKWNSSYKKEIAFYKDEIVYIRNGFLYRASRKMLKSEIQYPFSPEHYEMTLCPDSQNLVLLLVRENSARFYGYSKTVFLTVNGAKKSNQIDLSNPIKNFLPYLQGKEQDRIYFSFVFSFNQKKNFYINTQITGIVFDQDDEGNFYKIEEMRNGVPILFKRMNFVVDDENLLSNYITPKFVETRELIKISNARANELSKRDPFKNFSLNKWAFKKKKQSFFTSNTFYCISILSIMYTVGSFLRWLMKHRLK